MPPSDADQWAQAGAAALRQTQTEQLRLSLQQALPVNPDQFAESKRLAAATGVPIQTAQNLPDVVRTQAQMSQFDVDRLMRDAPNLSRWLGVQVNANVAHDDIPATAAVERAAGAVASVAPPSLLDDIWTGVKFTGRKVYGAWDKAAVALSDAMPDWTPGRMTDAERAAFLARGQQSQQAAIASPPKRWSGQVAAGLTYAPFLGATPGVVFGTEKTARTQQLIDQGVDPNTAATGGTIEGGTQAAIQMLPLGNLLFRQGGMQLIKSGAAAAAKSALAGAAQSGIGDTATSSLLSSGGYDKQAEDYIPSVAKMADSALFMAGLHIGTQVATHGTAAGLGAVSERIAAETAAEHAPEVKRAQDAQVTGQTLNAVAQAAAASKLRERDPQAFHDFVGDATNDASVYVDAADLERVFSQSGVARADLERTMPDVAEQLPIATETKGLVRMSVADFATHIAGTELQDALLPHLKLDPEGMTQEQAKQFAGESQQLMEQAAGKATLTDQVHTELERQAAAIEQDVTQQLQATGRYRDEVVRNYAPLIRDFVTTMAARSEMTPQDFYQQFPLRIAAERLAGLEQGNRGAYDPETRTIGLLKSADLSTFLHESGHLFLDTLMHLGARENLPAGVASDVRTVLDSFGIKDTPERSAFEQWHQMTLDEQRAHHEQFAQGFERYLLEGKAPSLEQQSLFQTFRSWLLRVYRSVAGLGVELSPEIRSVMDRMLATDDAIRTAEAARRYGEVFESAQKAGMTPEEWHSYQQLGQQATGDAMEALLARGVRDMQWLRNAQSRALKDLQAQADGHRRDVEREVRSEVMRQPVYQAWQYLTGKDQTTRHGEPSETETAWKQSVKDREAKRTEAKAAAAQAAKDKVLAAAPDAKGLQKGQLLAKNKRQIGIDTEQALLDWDKNNPKPAKPELPSTSEGGPMAAGKLSTSDLRAMFGSAPDALWRKLSTLRMTSDTVGEHPDIVAERFGFNSGEGMVRALASAEHPKTVIEGLTDQRMLERHGELATPEGLQRAADEAVHNEARAKFIATEYAALKKASTVREQTARGGSINLLKQAADEVARNTVARIRVRDLNPNQFTAAEGKAGVEAQRAMTRGDLQGAAEAKRAQLLNNRLAREALDARNQVEAGLRYLGKLDRDAARQSIGAEYMAQIDALLDRYDLRRSVSGREIDRRQSLLDWVQSQREQGYEPQVPEKLLNEAQRVSYKSLPVEEFRGLVDAVKSIDHLGRLKEKLLDAKGERDLAATVDSLVQRMDERGERFSKGDLVEPPKAHVDGYWAALSHWLSVKLRLVDSALKPQEFKFNKFDLHQIEGPFRREILDPLLDSNYRKVDLTKAVSDRAGEIGKALGKDWQKSLYDMVENRRLVDPDLSTPGNPVMMMKITRGRMLGIARHVGNESNFTKLVEGYGWHPQEVWAFLRENMTAKDWQATQAHWDSFEPLWVETEAMMKRIGGVAPEKIPARAFEVVPKDGTQPMALRGGYSPLDYDPLRSKLSVRKGEFTLGEGDKVGEMVAYKATTTRNGSLNNRVDGYTDRVNLDFHSAEARIRDTIHDLAYREALINARKITAHAAFRDKFMATYGREEYQALQTLLTNIRDANVTDPRTRNFEKAMQYMRQGVVLTGIGYRVSTVLKHGGAAALKSLGYLGNADGAKYFAARVARMASGHAAEDIAAAREKFDEIRTRMLQMDRDYSEGNRSMYEAEDWRAKNDRYGHAMVAWSDALSAVPTAWAAYDLAKTSGVPKSMGGTGLPMSEAEAVRYANSIVRQAHGSALEVTRSNFMQQRGAMGFFGTLYGFMNNTYGQLGDLLDKSTSNGYFRNNPAAAARLTATLIIPALWTQWLKDSGPGDDENGLLWSLKAIAGEVAATVPFVRDAASMLEYNRPGQIAPLQAISDVIKSGKDLWEEAHGKSTRLIQDLSNAVGEWAHIAGLGQLGHILQYMRDVHEGQKRPESNAQAVKEAVVGGAKPHHK